MVGQAALGLEARADDAATRTILQPLDHGPTHQAVHAERAYLAALGGGCAAPVAAHATIDGDRLILRAMIASADGGRIMRDTLAGPADQPEALGAALAERLLASGGADLVAAARR
jgi:hydroxymethylbilane synthase